MPCTIRRRPAVLTSLVSLLALPAAAAELRPYAPEQVVNAYTTGSQERPQVGVDAEGRVAVLWRDPADASADAKGRRFGSGDAPSSEEFPVDLSSLHDATALAGGGIVATSDGFADGGGSGVSAVVLDADDVALGAEFGLATYTTNQQRRPEVAATSDGGFVVAWTSYGSSGDDQDATSVAVRTFSSDGTPTSDEIQANTITGGNQRFADVAARPGGGFVVAWESYGSAGDDHSQSSVQVRRFASDGQPVAAELQVNSFTTGYQDDVSVGSADDGSFLVVWRSDPFIDVEDVPRQATREVLGQVFDASGAPIGAELVLDGTGELGRVAIASPLDDRFVVIAEGGASNLTGLEVRFDVVPFVDAAFAVNGYTTGVQGRPAVAAGELGDFVVVWQSEPSPMGGRAPGDDGDGSSIQIRRFGYFIFDDGFEGENLDAWSESFPAGT